MNSGNKTKPPALILAGGKSRRMGFPKLLLASAGDLLIDFMIERLEYSGWGEIAVTVSDESLADFVRCRYDNVAAIVNHNPDEGMISSIRLGLNWAEDAQTGLLTWPIDHPLVGVSTLQKMLRFSTEDAVTVPTFDGKRGHPTFWGKESWTKLRSTAADQGAREILMDPAVEITEVGVEFAALLSAPDRPSRLDSITAETDLVKREFLKT